MRRSLRNPVTDAVGGFWRNLSRNEKIAVGVGGGVLAVGTLTALALAFSDDVRPRRAIEVAPGCTGYSILDEGLLRDQLRAAAREAAARGPIDPLTLAARYAKSIAPACRTYPAKVDLPSEVELYITVTRTLLDVMRVENMISEADAATWHSMLATWAAGQGVETEV